MATSPVDFEKFTDTERQLCIQANRVLQALCRLPVADSLEYLGWETRFYGEIMKIRDLQKQEPKARVHALLVSALLCYARSSTSPNIAAIRVDDPQIPNSPYYRAGLCYLELGSQWGLGEDNWWTDFGLARELKEIVQLNGQTASDNAIVGGEKLGKRPRPSTPDASRESDGFPQALWTPAALPSLDSSTKSIPHKRSRRVSTVSQSELVNSVKARTSESSRKTRSPGGALVFASQLSRLRSGKQRTAPGTSRTQAAQEDWSEGSEDDQAEQEANDLGSVSAIKPKDKKYVEDMGIPTIFSSLVTCQKCRIIGMQCKFDMRVSHNCLVCLVSHHRCSLSPFYRDDASAGPRGDAALLLMSEYHALLFKMQSEGVDPDEYPQHAEITERPECDIVRRHRHIFSKAGKLSKSERAAIITSVKAEIAQRPGKPSAGRPCFSDTQRTTGRDFPLGPSEIKNAAGSSSSANGPSSSLHMEQFLCQPGPQDVRPIRQHSTPVITKVSVSMSQTNAPAAARSPQGLIDSQSGQQQPVADNEDQFVKLAETILSKVDSRLRVHDERMTQLFADLKSSITPVVGQTLPSNPLILKHK